MTEIPKDIRALFWADEELDDAERARLEAYLEAHPAERARRDRVLSLERDATKSPSIPPFDDAGYELSAEDARQERASFHAWGRRGESAPARPKSRGQWFRWAVPATVALAATVTIWFVGPSGGDLSDVAVLSVDREGLTRSVESGDVWRSGDAFALEARVARGVVPFLFLVDPSGDAALLHPPEDGPSVPASRNEVVRFPVPASGEIWVLGPETGRESFLLAAGSGSSPSPAELAARVATLSPASGDRAQTVAALVALLEAEVGPVTILEIDHRP